MFTFLTILFTILISATQNKEQSLDLNISISNVNADHGVIKIAVYDDKNNFPEDHIQAVALAEIPVTQNDGAVIAKIKLNAGTYAVSLFHDLNQNKKLDKGIFGIPKEPWGCSGTFKKGPPDFEDSSFVLDSNLEINVSLRD